MSNSYIITEYLQTMYQTIVALGIKAINKILFISPGLQTNIGINIYDLLGLNSLPKSTSIRSLKHIQISFFLIRHRRGGETNNILFTALYKKFHVSKFLFSRYLTTVTIYIMQK